jgi:PKD repeat protein
MTLTVNESPTISNQPISTTVCNGTSAQMSVSASGTAPLTYQWYKSSTAISGATSSSYLVSQASSSTAGTYYVVVSNACGSLTSNNATLTVNSNVSLTAQSASTSVCEGASPSFSVTASGTAPITYQWYKGSSSISGATNNLLSLTSVDNADAANYYVIASNACNSVQSNIMTLTVNESPTISNQPISTTVCNGTSAQMSVSASGTAPLTYQWYKSSTAISGATSSNYLVSQASSSTAGTYYVVVSNACGSLTSNNASLTVNTPVAINSQTGDSTKCVGESITFVVTASGTSPIAYQWYKGGSAISGASSSSYTIPVISSASAGDYYCILSNTCNSAQSTSMSLTVNTSPTVASQSASVTKCNGENLNLSITAAGTSPYSYQWYDGTGAISGAISNIYSMFNLASSNAGTYYCKISNSCGNVNSSNIVVSINNSPQITSQTASNISVCENSNTSLQITASGTTPLTYQWYNSVGSISLATAANLSINSADTSDADTYYCVATNSCGSAQSQSIALVVNQAPSINSQSASGALCLGGSFSASVSANGSSPLSYQWYKSSGSIIGANTSLLLINSIDTSDADDYYCVVSNGCGTVQSTTKTLVVNQSPSFTSQSTSLSQCESTTAIFTVSAIGSNPLNYQWYTDAGIITGANANTYSLPSISVSNAGNYYCVVSNNCGSINSSNKYLTVNISPVVTNQIIGDTLCESSSTILQFGVSGTNPITYQWYKSNVAIPSAVNAYHTLSTVDSSDAGDYYATATNLCGSIQSNTAHLEVNQLVAITLQSGDSSRCEGESVFFNVQTVGTAPLQYQWYKGNTAIGSANGSGYNLTNLGMLDAGYYYVKVSNMCNTVNSTYKQLTMHANPIVDLGNDTTFCQGGTVVLTAGFGNQCQWSNGSLNNQIAVTQSGNYSVQVTNQYGCQGNSDTVAVNVIAPYANQSLCVVGVDTASSKNILVWDKTLGVGIESYNLYKESSVSNVWTLIGNVDLDSLSTFIDLSSTPNVKPERYAISSIDSCGNESAKSNAHRTMHLTVNAGQTANEWNLLWNAYQGFMPATYVIYRADSTMIYQKLDSIAGSSSYTYLFTDHNAPNGIVNYMVEIIHPTGGCNPSKANTNYNSSRSNTASNGVAPNTALVPNFIATPTTGIAPIIVLFYDQTTNGTVDSYFWNFGDGANSVSQNPVHQYDSAGVYHVSLTVSNIHGTQSILKTNFIDVLPNGLYNIHDNFDISVFPNPYSGFTNIDYALITSANVNIQIYNSLGELVTVLVNEKQAAASYHYSFSAEKYGFSSGVYYLRMTLDNEVITKRLMEVK